MLLNCLHCGKSISNRKDFCPYCNYEIPVHLQEMKRQPGGIKKGVLKDHLSNVVARNPHKDSLKKEL